MIDNDDKDYVGAHPFKTKPRILEKRGIPYSQRIMVLGDTGFFGKNIFSTLQKAYPTAELFGVGGKRFFDLTTTNETRVCFDRACSLGPIQKVIHLAAYSGGMFENMNYQAAFWYQNTMMVANVIEECARHKVGKLLIPIGGCSYPDTNEINNGIYKEDDLFEGFANKNSYGYSMAKKQAVIAAMAYRQQVNLQTTVVIPTNPIGPWDNVDPNKAHVPMALIGRFLEAVEEGYSNVTVYGSGEPLRDFLDISSILEVFPILLSRNVDDGVVNISSGKGTSIRELAETISKVVGFKGNIVFDKSKPDGQAVKILDNSKLLNILKEENYIWEPRKLYDSIELTVDWYKRRVKI